MVDRNTQRKFTGQKDAFHGTLSTTVGLNEIADNLFRMEASTYNIDLRQLLAEIKATDYDLYPLFEPNDGLCTECSIPRRMKRHKVSPDRGVPLLSSSDIIALYPEASQHISRKLTDNIEDILIDEWDVLISRSGTVGNVNLAGSRIAGMGLSEHALRLKAPTPQIAGYVTAYLRSKYGNLQLTKASYGSVVTHIEPQHLSQVVIPKLHPIQQTSIGQAFVDACYMRDEANNLLDKANTLLAKNLRLPDVGDDDSTDLYTTVKASQLTSRFEASYHNPLVRKTLTTLQNTGHDILRLDNELLTKEIRPITRFRKRTYVESGGIPLLSSKQLFQIAPVNIKKLAKGAHTKDLPEIALEENMLAVTCSGTIGRVQIIPAYMGEWTANQHAIRIIGANELETGYLYTWLASRYGYIFITRESYGSVILEIDKDMLSSVLVPFPTEKIRHEIGALVLEANSLRNTAWLKEQEAIQKIEALIQHPTS